MNRKLVLALIALALSIAAIGLGAHYYWTHRYDSLIVEMAQRYKLDPPLVKAVIYEESYFDPRARSSQNAIGLMQVTSIAAQEWVDSTRAGSLKEALTTISNRFNQTTAPELEVVLTDPLVNLHIGCWYLQNLLHRYRGKPDPLSVALAAYNAGPSNAEKWAGEDASPLSRDEFLAHIDFPVTRGYVQKIIARYDGYKQDGGIP